MDRRKLYLDFNFVDVLTGFQFSSNIPCVYTALNVLFNPNLFYLHVFIYSFSSGYMDLICTLLRTEGKMTTSVRKGKTFFILISLHTKFGLVWLVFWVGHFSVICLMHMHNIISFSWEIVKIHFCIFDSTAIKFFFRLKWIMFVNEMSHWFLVEKIINQVFARDDVVFFIGKIFFFLKGSQHPSRKHHIYVRINQLVRNIFPALRSFFYVEEIPVKSPFYLDGLKWICIESFFLEMHCKHVVINQYAKINNKPH